MKSKQLKYNNKNEQMKYNNENKQFITKQKVGEKAKEEKEKGKGRIGKRNGQ